MHRGELLRVDDHGLYCIPGGFYIDPWRPRDDTPAVITHVHADHARAGARYYVVSAAGEHLARLRLGADADIRPVPYGRVEEFRAEQGAGSSVSLHPAGHVLGSAQVRIVADGYPITVVTGDFKRDADPTCARFETVECDTLIMEATFGLPVYRWRPIEREIDDLLAWWIDNTDRASMLFTYALGKAQRILAELARRPDTPADRPILCHGAVVTVNRAYEHSGVDLGSWAPVGDRRGDALAGSLVIAPPSAHRSPWMKRAHRPATAFASGWMTVRGARRRRGYERGFVVSDHADWPGLIRTVKESGAGRVLTTHGQNETFARYVGEELGPAADALGTLYEGDAE
jgi:putative mRNA 3-end processing factor